MDIAATKMDVVRIEDFPKSPRFRPLRLLGRGSTARVFLAFDEELGAEVAVKTLGPLDPERLLAIKREFRQHAEITHLNLVELYELVVVPTESFFTMEFVDGPSFVDHARTEPDRLHDTATQLAAGVAALHGAGKLHRDIKPSNVLVSKEHRVVLLDFGLAGAFGDRDEDQIRGTLGGTLEYMAPEQAWGQSPAPAADWYAVGVLLYEAVTGRLPFPGEPIEALAEKARGRPAPPSSIAPNVAHELDALILDLLDPAPERRPGGAEIVARLESLRSGRLAGPRTAPQVSDAAFVDRTEELARLATLMEEVRGGEFRVAHVSGSSGIGKSTLIRRFLTSTASTTEALVLRGRCHPDETVPFNAVDPVVDELARHLPLVSARMPRETAELARLFPVLGRSGALQEERDFAAEPHEMRRRAFDAFAGVLASISKDRPLVVWIDDVQWSDSDSVRLLSNLLQRPSNARMLWILSERTPVPTSFCDRLELEETSFGPGRLETISLQPLDGDNSRRLVQGLLGGGEAAEAQTAAIVSESDGSPLLLSQLATTLARFVAARQGTGVDDLPVTLRLADLVRVQVRRLPPEPRNLLDLLCVAGLPLERTFAISIAGPPRETRAAAGALIRLGLVRNARVGDRPALEIYHDRIRETVLGEIGEAQLREHHATLAEAHLASAAPDPEALFRHVLGSGDREEAAVWAIRAADRAASALAFDRAATFYGRALELKSWTDAEAGSLHTRRGEALVNAGRSADAAKDFIAAARRVAGAAAVDLRRRAADHLMISGQIDAGVEELRTLLADLGLPSPPSTLSAGPRTFGALARLGLRQIFRREPRSGPTSPSDLMRVEACHSAFRGYSQFDPMKGPYFAVQQLLRAIESGDPYQIALGQNSVGLFLTMIGGPLGRIGRRLLEQGGRYARETGDVYLTSVAGFARAAIASEQGNWSEVLDSGWTAFRALRANCRGVRWETNIARMLGLRGLVEQGPFLEFAQRAEEMRAESASLGDLYGEVTARLYLAEERIAVGDIEGARGHIDRIRSMWTDRLTSVQTFYALRILTRCDLYEGEPLRALSRVDETWPGLRRSGLLFNSIYRYDAFTLRAQATLATIELEQTRSGHRRVLRDARRLGREHRPDAIGYAHLIRAGLAAAGGAHADALASLEAAENQFAAAGLDLHASHARRRRGELIGGSAGATLIERADELMRERGIRDPERWLRIHAPGFNAAVR